MSLDILSLLVEKFPKGASDRIPDAFYKAKVRLETHDNIMCSVSGGSDSDLVVDMISRLDDEKKVRYVFFDTGIEYRATHEHLDYLEMRYDIKIERVRAKMSVALAVKNAYPFMNKQASEYIHRLQINNFDFARGGRSYEELIKEYPNCKSALRWWCNLNGPQLNIDNNKYLKEFMILNPPEFPIHKSCCVRSKEAVADEYVRKNKIELVILGMRKAEGGLRSTTGKGCTLVGEKVTKYRPLWWFSDVAKREYEKAFDIKHSRCYTEYGLNRTGCVGCPFGRNPQKEIEACIEHEPQMAIAVKNIFEPSYSYEAMYREFVGKQKLEEG